jgi:hypothetical protein
MKNAIYLNYTPTGKWVFVGSVPPKLAGKVFDTLSKAKKWATTSGYTIQANGKVIQ